MQNAQNDLKEQKLGFIYSMGCYVLWGIFPIYWHSLANENVPADQILAQRIIWSFVFALIILPFRKQVGVVLSALKQPKIMLVFFATAALLSINWLTYVWAVTNEKVLDSSLGYFMSPLFSILLGRIFLKEKLNFFQKLSVFIAVLGVLWLTFQSTSMPWIAISLTLSFGFYGLLKKTAPLPPVPSLVVETLWMFPFALIFLFFVNLNGELIFGELTNFSKWILVFSGVVTTVPLILFAAGAKRISLTNLSIVQYVSPTIQFLIGLLVLGEKFSLNQFIGYALVWIAVALYVYTSLVSARRLDRKIIQNKGV